MRENGFNYSKNHSLSIPAQINTSQTIHTRPRPVTTTHRNKTALVHSNPLPYLSRSLFRAKSARPSPNLHRNCDDIDAGDRELGDDVTDLKERN
ncbi:hypothetical protein Trydic_g23063 [Trypoxylus dichotomus]